MIETDLESVCNQMVNELNVLARVQRLDTPQQRVFYAAHQLRESDFVYRIGSKLSGNTRYSTIGADICVPDNNYEIQVKYWRYWFEPSKSYSGKGKAQWEQTEKDFQWLWSNLPRHRGERAFIGCWSPSIPWTELISFGTRRGQNPPVNHSRMRMFPFLRCPIVGHVKDIKLDDYSEWAAPAQIVNDFGKSMYCTVYGSEDDFINIVTYF